MAASALDPLVARTTSDALAARARGYRAITVSCRGALDYQPNQHHPTDTPDRVDPEALERAFAFASARDPPRRHRHGTAGRRGLIRRRPGGGKLDRRPASPRREPTLGKLRRSTGTEEAQVRLARPL